MVDQIDSDSLSRSYRCLATGPHAYKRLSLRFFPLGPAIPRLELQSKLQDNPL